MRKYSDSDFLLLLGGEGKTLREVSFRAIMRRGDLLLLLPNDKELAIKTLSLYQPQTVLAKWFLRVMKGVFFCGAEGVLKQKQIVVKESSSLAQLARQGEFGVLLGNPYSPARRAICFQHLKGKDLVTKVGVLNAAKETVEVEADHLESLPEGLRGAPILVERNSDLDWASYTASWVDGRSPRERDIPSILSCLTSWHEGESLQRLDTLPVWGELKSVVKEVDEKNYLEKVEHLLVAQSIVHGDLAPWNIKIEKSGKLTVLDWEFYRRGGAAGWDWAHYFIQSAKMIDKGATSEVLAQTFAWAESVEGQEYLKLTGWGQEVNAWIGTYLLYTHYVLKFDREDLLECWKKMQ